MTKTNLRIPLFALICVLLQGCLVVEFPISKKGDFSADASLTGMWVDREHDLFVKILAQKDKTYRIITYFNNENAKPVEFVGIPSYVGGNKFISIKTVKSNEPFIPASREYFVVKYDRINGGSTIHIHGLRIQSLPKGVNSPQSLLTFLNKNARASSLFEKSSIILDRL